MKSVFLVILGCLVGSVMYPKIYLWEQVAESGLSCCLHFDGADICNPETPCQNYIEGDLVGIMEYASRLLSTERGAVEPYHTDLVQVRSYIRKALTNPYYVITYQLDQHRTVPFYHELIDAVLKNKDKSSTTKDKDKTAKQSSKNDYVIQRLTELGLFIPDKKENRL